MSNLSWTQVLSSTPFLNSQIGINQNHQQENPAAFAQSDSSWLQMQGVFLSQLPGLQQIALDLKGRHKDCFFDQNFQFQGIQSFQTIAYLSNIGFKLEQYLKIGIGIGFQTFLQDTYYGNDWFARARLGLQYQQDSRHFFGFTFELFSPLQPSIFQLAYANQVGTDLLFFTQVKWVQSLPPQLFFGFEQKISSDHIRFFAAVQPQIFGCIFIKQNVRKSTWSIGLHWQNKLGIGFYWNLQFNHK